VGAAFDQLEWAPSGPGCLAGEDRPSAPGTAGSPKNAPGPVHRRSSENPGPGERGWVDDARPGGFARGSYLAPCRAGSAALRLRPVRAGSDVQGPFDSDRNSADLATAGPGGSGRCSYLAGPAGELFLSR